MAKNTRHVQAQFNLKNPTELVALANLDAMLAQGKGNREVITLALYNLNPSQYSGGDREIADYIVESTASAVRKILENTLKDHTAELLKALSERGYQITNEQGATIEDGELNDFAVGFLESMGDRLHKFGE